MDNKGPDYSIKEVPSPNIMHDAKPDPPEEKPPQLTPTPADAKDTGSPPPEPTPPTTVSSSKTPPPATAAATTHAPPPKCSNCERRWARKGCTMNACLTCCKDETCAIHKEVREKEVWKEHVLAGTTPIQCKAKELRAKAIPKGTFKETDFCYLGDTVVLWDLNQFMANDSWREEAIRKSKKRRARQLNDELTTSTTKSVAARSSRKLGRRKCFQQTMESLYQKSLATRSEE